MSVSKRCFICNKYSDNGITLLGKFICGECEQTLVNTDMSSEIYDKYKELIKEIYKSKAVK
ncbi:MAG: sigma factor G inhibitor Gin [Clostridiales bacterium]|nr:sigma factor G inhibitor Gin [Clostridiales bacterium]HBM79409.1 hypothetical protein [Clostridiaceae bacterium]